MGAARAAGTGVVSVRGVRRCHGGRGGGCAARVEGHGRVPARAQQGRHGARESRARRLDARDASAPVPSDKDIVLDDIARSVGFDEFNRRVREGMLAEYKRIVMSAMR